MIGQSLLAFILPDVFRPAQDSLRAIFKVPPEAQANLLSRKRIASAKTVMTPFVLRRKKLQVCWLFGQYCLADFVYLGVARAAKEA